MPVLILCDWSRYEAEQAFLREYYRADVMLLPYKYNMNLAQAAVKVGEARVFGGVCTHSPHTQYIYSISMCIYVICHTHYWTQE